MMRAWRMTALAVALELIASLAHAAGDAPPPTPERKVILLAGPLDPNHPRGTHEYEKSVRVIKHCLENSPNLRGVRTEAHLNGWPADARTLDDADAVVLVASGSDRREADHPLLVGNRLELLGKQMKRGCGLVLIHWATFVPQARAGKEVLDWIGGYFDYETGAPPRGWYSRIQTATSEVRPATRGHPITRGLDAFQLRDEFYYQMRFRDRDPRLVPLLSVALPNEAGEQVVAWCVDRQDGGRGVGFTGGHFFDNWQVDGFRRFVLNAIVWAAGGEVPMGGVASTAPSEPQLASVAVRAGAQRIEEPTLATGRFGKALDARAGGVTIAGDERFRHPPLTVECWAKLFDRKGFNVLVASDLKSSGRHWELYSYAGSGSLSVYLPGMEPSEIVSDRNACDGNWHYLAFTFDGKEVKLFVDGHNVKTQVVHPRPGLKPEPGPLTIGHALANDHRVGCNGLVDDVRISNVVRDLATLPTAELPHDPLTVGLWRFDKPEGLTVDAAWTPPPGDEKSEPWERETDVHWVDGRLREMDTGPTFNATFEYPSWKGKTKVYKGMAIKVGANAAMLFDRGQLRWAAGWTGGFLNHSDRRFGLLNTPTPAGQITFASNDGPGWARTDGDWGTWPTPTAPLPADWGRYQGHHLSGDQVAVSYAVHGAGVLELPGTLDAATFTRTMSVGPSAASLRCLAADLPGLPRRENFEGLSCVVAEHAGRSHLVALRAADSGAELAVAGQRVELKLAPGQATRLFKIYLWSGNQQDLANVAGRIRADEMALDAASWAKPGPPRWQPLATQREDAPNDAPYVVDTLSVPYDNPYKALMFLSGVDFLPSGDVAVCSAHGDVWLVSGVDDPAGKLRWQRFATGLYQPLGLKVVDGKIVVLERGQLTRLFDVNGDGEADRYENVANDWHTGAGEHSYDTCLETDPQGNFYFFKTGDAETPTGGCLLRVSSDGKKTEVFCTGFRHPIGLGMSPAGAVSGADQEGNWMPATRIDLYKQGGFYGDMRTHHRREAPKTYDPPLLWLPREADNSAGGQVWVTDDRFGPLQGKMLHLSYGRCRLLAILPQQVGDVRQAGAVDLGVFFLSGAMRGRFRPQDGHLYVAGLRGWQTAARRDGCLQRVRFTGQPATLPRELGVHESGVRLTFSQPLDPTAAADPARFAIEQWNYRWSGDYGSKHWSVIDPTRQGHDAVKIHRIELASDGRSVFLATEPLRPVMQMRITYDLKTSGGQPFHGKTFSTIHALAPPRRVKSN